MKHNGPKEEPKEADDNEIDISNDSKLYKALEALNDENIQELMEEGEEEEPAFSEDHNQKMQQMIEERFGQEAARRMEEIQKSRNTSRNKAFKKHNVRKPLRYYPGMKKVAAAVLVFALLFAVVMSTEAFRLPITNFIMNVKKEFMTVNVESSEPPVQSDEGFVTIERVYTLGKTIKGYEIVFEEIDDMHVLREYKNKEQDTYRFSQKNQVGNSFYDAEEGTNYEIIDTIYNGAIFSELNGIYSLAWVYDGYMFIISGNLTKEELVMLADSLTLEKDFGE